MQKGLVQITNIDKETIEEENKYRKIAEEFKLEEKTKRQRRQNEIIEEERKIKSERMKVY